MISHMCTGGRKGVRWFLEPELYSKGRPQMTREVPRGMRLAMLPESHVADGLVGGGRGERGWLRGKMVA